MKLRQLIITNPFQKSRDKKKKSTCNVRKLEKIQQNHKIDNSRPKNTDSIDSGNLSASNGVLCTQNIQYDLNINVSELRQTKSDSYCLIGSFGRRYYNLNVEQCSDYAVIPQAFTNGKISTVPRSRSRIKTNPWLKIPRVSSSTDTDSDDNNYISGSCQTDYGAVKNKPDKSLLNLCFVENTTQLKYRTGNNLDINISKREKSYVNKDECRNEVKYRWSIISEGDVSIDLNSPTLEQLGEQLTSIESSYSSEYEDNLDFVLEESSPKFNITCVSIQDLLSDDADESSLNTSMEQSDDSNSTCSVSTRDEGSDSCSQMDTSLDSIPDKELKENDTIVYQEKVKMPQRKCNSLEESIDAGYASLSRDGKLTETDSDSSSHRHGKSRIYFSSSDEESTLPNESKENVHTGNVNLNTTPTGRELSEVKNSLQEKVNQLRIEKVLVQKKIKEAQEEERIRTTEKRKFRSLLSSQKKQTLFKTLSDLKERLENQSMRLQKSYSTIMSMQRKFSQRKSTVFLTQPISM